ncbi:YoaK family protein [Anaerorhabdus sp.]|uniref:YoaK family protein n=1 Tax=Anaerorhabdus sp. TaxID=1872524 RepID=UPI002FC696A8
MNKSTQISDSVRLGLLLAINGGFMDAYSYVFRGKVFANAQTGNLLLLGMHMFEGEWNDCIRYIVPIIAFMIGIACAFVLRKKFLDSSKVHWRQVAILIEAIVLFVVSFIPQSSNLLANSLISLGCGLQVESFKKIHGLGASTTMCIGNLRSATTYFCEYFYSKNAQELEKGFLFIILIVFFVSGAIIGNIFIKGLGQHAIIICTILLLVGFTAMFIDKEETRTD